MEIVLLLLASVSFGAGVSIWLRLLDQLFSLERGNNAFIYRNLLRYNL